MHDLTCVLNQFQTICPVKKLSDPQKDGRAKQYVTGCHLWFVSHPDKDMYITNGEKKNRGKSKKQKQMRNRNVNPSLEY